MATVRDGDDLMVRLVTNLTRQCGAAHLVARPGWLDARLAAIARRRRAGAPVYLFVGERQSLRAAAAGATWYDGRFAGRTLHHALVANGVDPGAQLYTNLWRHPGRGAPDAGDSARTDLVRAGAAAGLTVVALGARVAAALADADIPCRAVPHPARQGPRRARGRYVADLGAGLVTPTRGTAPHAVERSAR